MGQKFETTFKGRDYIADVTEGEHGGYNLTIHLLRSEHKPKVCYTQHCASHFDAMTEMDEYLPEAQWKEKQK